MRAHGPEAITLCRAAGWHTAGARGRHIQAPTGEQSAGRREALEVDVLPGPESWNDFQAGRGALRQRKPVELAAAYAAPHARRADGLVCQGTRRSKRKAAH